MSLPSMYEDVMGLAFSRLSDPLRRFHSFAGTHEFTGWVEVHAPATLAAALLARCLGAPLKSASGPLRFELDAQPDNELWTRHFPAKTMASRLVKCGPRVVEHLGAARLVFELRERDGALEMRLERLYFLGIPCPVWLMPQLLAHERAHGDTLQFEVSASLPMVGTVASYCGHLDLAVKEAA